MFFPSERFQWDDETMLAQQFEAAIREFATKAGTAGQWEIYWAAGIGTMASPAHALAPETKALSSLLRLLASEPRLAAVPGAFSFASSAGAIYAGAPDYVITESTPSAPTTAYAHEKLRQEELVRLFLAGGRTLAVLIARISTLYGPAQRTGKPQGLLSHIARRIVRNQPAQIFVPLDTVRDYIAADDAAAKIIATLRASRNRPGVLMKIIASEQPTTIAEIVSVFKRISRRAPRIVTSASALSALYSRRMQFRSVVAPECSRPSRVTLIVGVAQLMAHERAAFARSPERYGL